LFVSLYQLLLFIYIIDGINPAYKIQFDTLPIICTIPWHNVDIPQYFLCSKHATGKNEHPMDNVIQYGILFEA
jgi:hypothetical protein